MKVLYASVMYDYNDKSRGMGLDYYTMYPAIKNLPGIETILFDCSDFGDKTLREQNNARLIKLVEEQKPDILFYVAFKDIITKDTLQYIKNKTRTTTINWFCDDHWQFDRFTKEWCWNFDYSITTDKNSLIKYQNIGYKNVLLSQWAAHPDYYPKLALPFKYDASFVGQDYGEREEILDKIKANGIKVARFGYGWKLTRFKKKWNKRFKRFPFLHFDSGKVSHEKMINIFNQSKINLNFSESSAENMPDQIKARNFEVPCCGGFLLTGKAPHLEDFYEIGKEIVCYDNVEDMIEKIKYYLAHEDQRNKIAAAGYDRTIKDHTYEKRFSNIFSAVKLK